MPVTPQQNPLLTRLVLLIFSLSREGGPNRDRDQTSLILNSGSVDKHPVSLCSDTGVESRTPVYGWGTSIVRTIVKISVSVPDYRFFVTTQQTQVSKENYLESGSLQISPSEIPISILNIYIKIRVFPWRHSLSTFPVKKFLPKITVPYMRD